MRLLQERVDECKGALSLANVAFGAKRAEPKDVDTYGFKKDPKDFNVYWDVRKGLIPIVGGARETGLLLLMLPLSSSLATQFEALLQEVLLCWQAVVHVYIAAVYIVFSPLVLLLSKFGTLRIKTPLSYWVYVVHTSIAHSVAGTDFI